MLYEYAVYLLKNCIPCLELYLSYKITLVSIIYWAIALLTNM